jgi:hypothetical protein
MQRFMLSVLVAGAAIGTVHASNPVAVYARVDRVVLAPSAEAPKTVQIFGVFSLAKPGDPNEYEEPARGYLYFTLGADQRLAAREWADLKAVAGTPQIVAFGSRYQMKARLRAEKEPADAPDTYTTGMGLTKVSGETNYAPIRALADYRK